MNPFPSTALLGLTVEEIHARTKRGTLAGLSETLVSHSRSLLDPKSEQFLDYRDFNKPFWRSRSGIFIIPNAMQMLAISGIITQDLRFSEAARDILLAIIDHGFADSESLAWGAKTSGWRHGEGHDKFLFAIGVWSVLEFAGDDFSANDCLKVQIFLQDSLRISLETLRGDYANVTNNRGVRGLLGSALWVLLLDGFEPSKEREAVLDRAWIGLEKHLYFAFDSHGAAYEGPAYAGNTLGSLALMAEILRRCGKPNLLLHRVFERHPRYLAYELVPGQPTVNNLNDSPFLCGSISGCLHRMSHPGGEIIAWLAHRLDLDPARSSSNPFAQTPLIRDFVNFLLWWDESVPTRSPQELGWPFSGHFPLRGVSSHRTGWGDKSLLASHFCGRQEVLCHRQGDQNHIALYAGGELLLVDAGYGGAKKDMSQKMDRWFGLTEAHNCVLIDGQNQRGVMEAPGWGEGEMLDFSESASTSTSLGDASFATGKDHRIRTSLRRLTIFRKLPFGVVTVVDVNEYTGNPFKTEILWHTHPDNSWKTTPTGGIIQSATIDCHVFIFDLNEGDFEIVSEIGFGRPRLRVCSNASHSRFLTLFLPLPIGHPIPQAILQRDEVGVTMLGDTFSIPFQVDK
jgi:hypothetical protein